MKKVIVIFLLLLLLSSSVLAKEEEKSECSWTNVGQCIIDGIVGAITGVLNLILHPFLEITLNFLKVQPNLDAFQNLWRVIISIISIFYSFIFAFSGFYLIFNSDNVEGRNKAKKYIKNGILIILLVQSSFYLYDVLAKFSTGLSGIALNHVDEKFLYIDYSSISGAIEETLMYLFYLAAVIITLILLAIRYFFASIAIIFFPISILLYFLPFTQQYGKFLLNLILVNLFVPFFASITLAGFSQLATTGIFQHFKTLLATVSFITIDIMLVLFAFFSVFSVVKESTNFVKGGYEWATTFHKR